MSDVITPLTDVETTALRDAESRIEKGGKTFIDVGNALALIRDEKLYRATHSTFAEYCKERWGFVRSRAYQFLQAAEVTSNLSTIVDISNDPKTLAKKAKIQNAPPESHLRELAKAPPILRNEALKLASEATPKPTAKDIAAAVKKVTAPKPVTKAADLPKDDRGVTLPVHLVTLWNRRDEISDLAGLVSRVRVAVRKAQRDDDPLFKAINFSTSQAHLDQAYSDLIAIRPICVCPMCQGEGCRACRGVGLMGKFAFEKLVPKELKRAGER